MKVEEINLTHIPTPLRISPTTPEYIFTVYHDGKFYRVAIERSIANDGLEHEKYETLYNALYFVFLQYCTLNSMNTIVVDYGENYKHTAVIKYATVNRALQGGGTAYIQTVISAFTGVTWCSTAEINVLFLSLCEDIIYHLSEHAYRTLYPGTPLENTPPQNTLRMRREEDHNE